METFGGKMSVHLYWKPKVSHGDRLPLALREHFWNQLDGRPRTFSGTTLYSFLQGYNLGLDKPDPSVNKLIQYIEDGKEIEMWIGE